MTNVQLEARPEAAGAARLALEPLKARAPADLVETAQLLVSELVTNSLEHAERHTADSIELDAEMKARVLHVEVTDSGPGFAPQISTPTMYQHSGWGLYLLDQLADRWGVEPSAHDVSVWFELDLPA